MFPPETFRDTLLKFIRILNEHEIRYHLTGGLTSVLYGEPRMTQDVDVVIENPAATARLDAFLASLAASDFLHNAAEVRAAVEGLGMFRLLDKAESLKIDVYARELIPGELDRAVQHEVFTDLSLPVASRADTAAAKLVWISKGSHKSRRDLRAIHRQCAEEDRISIGQLAAELGLHDLLLDVLAESDEIRD